MWRAFRSFLITDGQVDNLSFTAVICCINNPLWWCPLWVDLGGRLKQGQPSVYKRPTREKIRKRILASKCRSSSTPMPFSLTIIPNQVCQLWVQFCVSIHTMALQRISKRFWNVYCIANLFLFRKRFYYSLSRNQRILSVRNFFG